MLSPDEIALDKFSSKPVSSDDIIASTNSNSYLNYIYNKYNNKVHDEIAGDVEKNTLRQELIKMFENDLQLNCIKDDLTIPSNTNDDDDDIIDVKKNLTYSGSCIAPENYSIAPMIDNFVSNENDELLTDSYYEPSYFTTTFTKTNTTTTNNTEELLNNNKNNYKNNSSFLSSSITKLSLENLAPNLQKNCYKELIRNKTVICDADLLLYSYMQQKSLNYTNENDIIEDDEYIEINCDNYNSEVDEYEIVDINTNDYMNIIDKKYGSIKIDNDNKNKIIDDNVEYF